MNPKTLSTYALLDLGSLKPVSLSIALVTLTIACQCGCTESGTVSSDKASTSGAEATAHSSEAHAGHDHDHDHPTEGPHHGDLIELGDEEYHAELVHGEDGAITVYILDGTAKVAVPIDATEIAVNISHDGNAEQFKLLAERESTDPEGMSSRFSIKDTDLASDLDDDHTTGKLVVTIGGKPYSGKLVHNHESEHTHDAEHKH